MAILITGIAGFIGSNTAKRLLSEGVEVVGVDNFNDYYDPQIKRDRIAKFLADYDFKVYECDIADKDKLKGSLPIIK